MSALIVLEALVIALLAVLVYGLLRSHAEILRALHDLGVNLDDDAAPSTFRRRPADDADPSRAADEHEHEHEHQHGHGHGHDARPSGVAEAVRPTESPAALGQAVDLIGRTPNGETALIAVVGVAQPTLLAFLSSGCQTCADFWNAFGGGIDLTLDGREIRVVVVTKGHDEESPGAVAELAPAEVTTVMSTEAYVEYGVPVSPYFVLAEAHSGRIVGEGAARSFGQLAGLLERAVADGGSGLSASRTRRELLNGAARQRRNSPD